MTAEKKDEPKGLRMMQIRAELGKTSTKKYAAMKAAVCPDGRLRGILQFYGANRTGRWAGRIVQVHNLPQNKIPDIDLARELAAEGDFETLQGFYDEGIPFIFSQLMVTGAAPSGVTSGTAISNLLEIDNTRLSLTGDHIRNAVKKLAVLWLEIYKRYATTLRILNYVGTNNIGKALVWSSEDIESYDVDYMTENELLMSEDAQRENFLNAYNMGLFTDSNGVIPERVKLKALEAMKIGNYTDLMSINTLQIQAAQRENAFFERGVIPKVSEFDDHTIHIEEHMRYILQMDFQILKYKKPEYARALEEHIKQHEQAQMFDRQKAAQMSGIPLPK